MPEDIGAKTKQKLLSMWWLCCALAAYTHTVFASPYVLFLACIWLVLCEWQLISIYNWKSHVHMSACPFHSPICRQWTKLKGHTGNQPHIILNKKYKSYTFVFCSYLPQVDVKDLRPFLCTTCRSVEVDIWTVNYGNRYIWCTVSCKLVSACGNVMQKDWKWLGSKT